MRIEELPPGRAASDETPSLLDRLVWCGDMKVDHTARYAVKGLIDLDTDCLMVGAPNCGKSFLAMHLACTLASPLTEFFGMRAHTMPIVYMAAEGSEKRVHNRILAWCRHHNVNPADVDLAVLKYSIDLIGNSSTSALDEVCKMLAHLSASYGKPVGGILDTVTAAAPGGNLNAPDDSSRVTRAMTMIRGATGLGFVLGIHHTPQDNPKKPAGHHNFLGQVDTVIAVIEQEDGTRNVVTPKQRDQSKDVQMAFRLESVNLGIDEEGDAITTCVPVSCEPSQKDTEHRVTSQEVHALEVLREIGRGSNVKFGDWFRECRKRGVVKVEDEAKKESAERALRRIGSNLRRAELVNPYASAGMYSPKVNPAAPENRTTGHL